MNQVIDHSSFLLPGMWCTVSSNVFRKVICHMTESLKNRCSSERVQKRRLTKTVMHSRPNSQQARNKRRRCSAKKSKGQTVKSLTSGTRKEARMAAVTTLEMPHGRPSLEQKQEMKGMDWGKRGRAHLLGMPRRPQKFRVLLTCLLDRLAISVWK